MALILDFVCKVSMMDVFAVFAKKPGAGAWVIPVNNLLGIQDWFCRASWVPKGTES